MQLKSQRINTQNTCVEVHALKEHLFVTHWYKCEERIGLWRTLLGRHR